MRFAALSTVLLAIAQHVQALPVETDGTPALDITLSRVTDTRIKAVVKNSGSEDVTFVHLNFFRDAAPVKKVNVFKNGTYIFPEPYRCNANFIPDDEVTFEGIKRRFALKGLTKESLTSLASGETFEDEFDIASTSDLSSGGPLTLRSTGLVPLVTDGAVTGYLPYRSNDLEIEVDGAKASRVLKAIKTLDRRALPTCRDSSKKAALDKALKNTVTLANAAAKAALSGSSSKYVHTVLLLLDHSNSIR
jgi:deuterolysin